MFFLDNLRGLMQVASAGVVAEAAPVGEYLVFRCGSQHCNVRKCGNKAQVVGNDGGDLRLLQHNFGQPHAVSILPLPGQVVATVLFLPANEALGKRMHE